MKFLSLIMVMVIGFVANIAAQDLTTADRQEHYNIDKKELAVKGYDPVSYFSGKPRKGSKNFQHEFKGVIYRFTSQANLDTFKADPEKYEPMFGGWCAFAMGDRGEKVKVDPKNFKIVDGKLHLFYKGTFVNTKPKWNKDEDNLKVKAAKNWASILGK